MTQDPTVLELAWTTRDTQQPAVKLGSESGVYTQVFPAQSHAYKQSDMCGEPASGWGWMDPGVFHVATLSGLIPGATYYYMVGEDAYGWSEEHTLVVPPAVGRDTSVSLFAFGCVRDAEIMTTWARTCEQNNSEGPDTGTRQ
jgi:hypothetical protein